MAQQDLAREHFGVWCQLALRDNDEKPAPHHWLLIKALEGVERGDISRLAVIMPPGAAKTTYSTVLFPPWFLARKKGRKVILASYSASLAEVNNGKTHRIVEDYGHWLGLGCRTDAVSHWQTDNDGEIKAAGVDGPITGFRADLLVIDDPVKNEHDVDSELRRDNVFKWYWSAVNTRLKAGKKATKTRPAEPGGAVVVVMTRWHEDDLLGRLLLNDRERWTVLHLPAEALEPDPKRHRGPDPLGRKPGEMLWDGDENYDYGETLRRAKEDLFKNGGQRTWQSLYQGDPLPGEGALFDVKRVTRCAAEDVPAGGLTVRSWDFAATAKVGTRNPDWTVGVKMKKAPDGRCYVLDVKRFRGRPEEIERELLATARADGTAVRILLPQDPAQAGVWQVQHLTRLLSGFDVKAMKPSGNKSTRAAPFAAQVNAGNVWAVQAPWVAPYLDELGAFPAGTYDDQVDASADAFAGLGSTGIMKLFRLGY